MPQRRRLRPRLVLLHRYLAVALGAWFVLLGLTGIVLLFRDDVDRLLNPQLLRSHAASSTAVSPIAIQEAALRRYPAGLIEQIRLPWQAGDVYRVLLRADAKRGVGGARIEATFDPADGRWLGERDPAERSLRTPALLSTIHDLHQALLLENQGKDLVGLVGLSLALMIVVGFVLAFPRLTWQSLRRAIAVKRASGTTRRIYDLHRALGTVLGIVLLMSAGTGALMAYPDLARDLVGLASPARPLPVVPWRAADAPADAPVALDEVLAIVGQRHPQASIREIHFPGIRRAPMIVYLHRPGDIHRLGDTRLLIGGAGTDLLREVDGAHRSRGERLLHWLHPLHTGSAFGTPGRLLMVIGAGLLPLWLLVTGVWIWVNKRRAWRRTARRR